MDNIEIGLRQDLMFVQNVFLHKYNMLDAQDTSSWMEKSPTWMYLQELLIAT